MTFPRLYLMLRTAPFPPRKPSVLVELRDISRHSSAMLADNWTIDAELRTADIAVVLMTHGATGPLVRTHRMVDHTISLFLT
jgi:hypothetical protein